MKLILIFSLLLSIFTISLAQQQVTYSQFENDNNALNFALSLEHLEANFYTQGQQLFSSSDFNNAGYSTSIYNYISLIQSHEVAHVDFLTQALQARNSTAVIECTYNFNSSFSNVSSYLALAQFLENAGVMAYDGALNTITDASLITAAATIATTEARHAAFLNELNNQYAFNNNSFDTALAPATVQENIMDLIISCPLGSQQNLPDIRFSEQTYFLNGTVEIGTPLSPGIETAEAIQNDNELLNFILHIEQFGRAFYNSASALYNVTDFLDAGFNMSVYNHFLLIVAHENAHVAFLTSTLTARNTSVIQPCTYDLTDALASVQSVLTTARMAENLETSGYDGAIDTLTDPVLIEALATIVTIEARHAGYLNYLLLDEPLLNQSRDSTLTALQILNITSGFFVSCPEPVVIPQPYYLFNAVASQSPSPVSTSPSFSPSSVASQSPSPVSTRSSSTSQLPVASQSPSPVSIIEQSSSGSTLSCLTIIRSLVQWGKSFL